MPGCDPSSSVMTPLLTAIWKPCPVVGSPVERYTFTVPSRLKQVSCEMVKDHWSETDALEYAAPVPPGGMPPRSALPTTDSEILLGVAAASRVPDAEEVGITPPPSSETLMGSWVSAIALKLWVRRGPLKRFPQPTKFEPLRAVGVSVCARAPGAAARTRKARRTQPGVAGTRSGRDGMARLLSGRRSASQLEHRRGGNGNGIS